MKTVIITGGGTGGHIYPGISIANAIKKKQPETQIVFVGAKGGLEEDVIAKESFKLHLLRIGKLNNVSKQTKLLTLFFIPIAFFQSLFLLFKYRPTITIGVGGYASGPMVICAYLLGFKTAIWEANAIPGMTNRILYSFSHYLFITFKDSQHYFKKKSHLVGLPIRDSITHSSSPPPQAPPFHILVFGGSQGARGINKVVCQLLCDNENQLKQTKWIHQTGKLDYNWVKKAYGSHPLVECKEYLFDIDKYYQWAHLVICRSGASTINELAACKKASILIPFPFASDNHQKKNAEALLKKNATLLLLQEDLTAPVLLEQIQNLINNPEQIKTLESNISSFYVPDAAQTIAKILLDGTN